MRCRPLVALLIVLAAAAPAAAQGVGKSTIEGLLYDLKSPDAFRRREAVQVLGDKKVSAAAPDLIRLVDDSSVDVRRALVHALANLDDPRVGPALAKMLDDTDKDVRKSSVRAIVEVYAGRDNNGARVIVKRVGSYFNPGLDEKSDFMIEPSVVVPREVTSGMAERLKDDDRSLRVDAARALGILRARGAIPAMIDALKSEKEKPVVLALMQAFQKIGDPRPGGELVLYIYHEDKALHDEAIYTVGVLKSKEAVADLTKIYESNVEERRTIFKIIPVSGTDDLQIRSLESLSRIAAPESKQLFVDALPHADARYRQVAAEGLARLGEKDQLTELSRLRLRENKENVKLALSFALFRLGRREYLDEVVHAAADGSDQAFGYLVEFHRNEVPHLYPYLEDSNPRARERTAEVLGLIGDEQAAKRLDPLTQDTNSEVLASAVRAIRRIQARSISSTSTSKH